MTTIIVSGSGIDLREQIGRAIDQARSAISDAIQQIASRLAIACETFVAALRALSIDIASFVTHHQPTRTRSGRWRLRLLGKTRIYRTRTLALAALRRELIGAMP